MSFNVQINTYSMFSNILVYLFFSMEGGELFQRIQEHNEGAFTERGKLMNIY